MPASMMRAGGRLLVALLIALGATWGGAGLREAAAESSGCTQMNLLPTMQGPSLFSGLSSFEAGEVVSVTASDPSTGSPTLVQLFTMSPAAAVVAEGAFPGTVSYTIPTTSGALYAFNVGVDQGSATLDFSCAAAAPATATATSTAPATETATPTAISIATETPTVTATATAQPTSTRPPAATVTATAIPTVVAPTTVPDATSTIPPQPTADEAGAVTELPNTGAGPDGGSAQLATWLVLLGLAAFSLLGLRRWRRHS